MSLYHVCLQTISLLLVKRFWMPKQVNPFQFLPSEVLHDLVATTLRLLKEDVFIAASLELLLTSGNLREFQIQSMNHGDELVFAFTSLSTACRNLEVINLTGFFDPIYTDASRAMTELVRNSPNLKYIHSEIEFDLKALSKCKKLKTVMLHFRPDQPWCDILKDEEGSLHSLESLQLFTICTSCDKLDLSHVDEVITILQHCPALISLGSLNTSPVLAQLHRTGVLPQVKLRCCYWGNSPRFGCEPEWIRDAMIYCPSVEELFISIHSIENITGLSTLRNLVFLDIDFRIEEDFSVAFHNVLKIIGHQLRYLCFMSMGKKCQVDISVWIQNCANLEVLILSVQKFDDFAEPSINLPNLKYLDIKCWCDSGKQILPLFLDCNNLKKLSSGSIEDETLDLFLRRNSLLNLKAVSFMPCDITKSGFKKFFLKTPELETIEVSDFRAVMEEPKLERDVKEALLETNHKAIFRDDILMRKDPLDLSDSNFDFFDDFIFNKMRCLV